MACLAFWTSVFSTLLLTISGWCRDLWKAELRYPSLISPGDGSRNAAILPIRSFLGAPAFLIKKTFLQKFKYVINHLTFPLQCPEPPGCPYPLALDIHFEE